MCPLKWLYKKHLFLYDSINLKAETENNNQSPSQSLCIHSPVPCISTAHSRLQFPDHDPAVAHDEGSCVLIDRTAHHTEGADSFRHPDRITLASQVIGKFLNGVWVLRENCLFQMPVRKHSKKYHQCQCK